MGRSERDLREMLKGKTIERVKVTECYAFSVNEKELECDDGDIFLVFTDGTKLRIWNSEWGGIELLC